MTLDAGREVGPWRIERVLGRGAMATVYAVRHRTLGSQAALKVLHLDTEEERERLLLEGQLQANLRHPNIVAVQDVQWVDGSLALVLEYVDGPDLCRRLDTGPPFDLDQIDLVARGILTGVLTAHLAGFVHRDLKPANVLLSGPSDRPVPKVSDFGVAKVLKPSAAGGLTGSSMVGSPAYMAAEQFLHASSVDHRADIHALGCLFYELLTGRPAYFGSSLHELQRRVESGDHVPVARLAPEAPARMLAAIEAALIPDLSRRLGSCEEMLAIWEGRTRTAVPAPPVEPAFVLAELRFDGSAARAADLRARFTEQTRRWRPARSGSARDGAVVAFHSGAAALAYVDACRAVVPPIEGCELHVAVHLGDDPEPDRLLGRFLALGGPGRVLLSSRVGVRWEGMADHGIWRFGVLDPIVLSERIDGEPAPLSDSPLGWRVIRQGRGWEPVRRVPHHLTIDPDPFIGREVELAAIQQAFTDARLVVVEGEEGAGKTTLAARFARTTLGGWSAGAWFCDLTGVSSAQDLAWRVATAVGIRVPSDDRSDPFTRIGDAVGLRGGMLIVLDRADDLDGDARNLVARWLERAPALRILVTTSRPLSVPGRHRIVLGPLPIPSDRPSTAVAALRSPAVALFVARLGRELLDRDARPVTTLVTALDGCPLAIDLAASIPGGDVADRCQRLAEFLMDQQQVGEATSAAVVRWCWGEATVWERSTLARCTVFAGGFLAEAAEAVVDLAGASWPPVSEILDDLVRRRWLIRAGSRLQLHPLVRAHAGLALDTEGLRRAEDRHAAWFVRSGASLDVLGDLQLACRRAIAAEDGAVAVSTCLGVAAATDEGGPAVDLAERIIGMRGLSASTRGHLCVLLAQGPAAAAELVSAQRDASQARTGERRDDHLVRVRLDDARQFARIAIRQLGRALELLEPGGNHQAAATVAVRRGDLQRLLQRTADAHDDYQRAAALLRTCGGHDGLSRVLRRSGNLHQDRGDLVEARRAYQQAAIAAYRSADVAEQGAVALDLARLEHLCHRSDPALDHIQQALVARQATGDRSAEAEVLLFRSAVERALDQPADAVRSAQAARALFVEVGDVSGVRWADHDLRLEAGVRPRSVPEVQPPVGPGPPSSARAGLDLLRQGRAHRDRGRNDWALGCFASAKWSFGAAGDRPNVGVALAEIGAIHRMRGHVESAARSYQAALATLRSGSSRDSHFLREVRRVLALLYEQQERTVDDHEKLEAALDRHRTHGRRAEEGTTLGSLALNLHQQGDLAAAGPLYEAAIARHRECRVRGAEGIDLGNLANLRSEEGRVDEAIELYRGAIDAHHEVGNLRGEGGATGNLALLLHHEGQLEASAEYHLAAIDLHSRAGQTARLAQTLGHLGDLRRLQGRLDDAEKWLDQALRVRSEVDDLPVEATLLGLRGALFATRRDPRGAEELFGIAARLLWGHPDPVRLAWLAVWRAEFELGRGDRELGFALLDEIRLLTPSAGRPLLVQVQRLRSGRGPSGHRQTG